MFDAEKRSRFRNLQEQQEAGLANADEQRELAKLASEIESA
jgi:hypothetical protein